jgi:hypothetical protein
MIRGMLDNPAYMARAAFGRAHFLASAPPATDPRAPETVAAGDLSRGRATRRFLFPRWLIRRQSRRAQPAVMFHGQHSAEFNVGVNDAKFSFRTHGQFVACA